jgi:hypothetical protein
MVLAVVLVVLVGAFSYTGCTSYMNEQGQQVTRLSDKSIDVLDKAVEVSPTVTDALVGIGIAYPAILPLMGIIAGVIGGLAGAYKKYRPELTAEQNKSKMYADTVTAIVYAIEQFKQSNGKDWADLKEELKKELIGKVGPEALAIIEAIIQAYQKREVIVNE